MPLPDHYETLEIGPTASQQEIERAHKRRAAELRASKVADAPEELAEVEAAYSVLSDPARRAEFDAQLRKKEEEEDKKFVELDAELQRSGHHRKSVKGSSGWLDAMGWLLKLFK